MPLPIIETPRLLLRPFVEEDLTPLAEITADPVAMRFIGAGRTMTPEQTARTVDYFAAHAEKHGFGPWGLVERGTGTFIGWCGLKYLNETDVELLYLLGQDAWGKGYATEAARASIDYGFGQAGLDRIVAIAWPENQPSRRVMEKIGMIFDRDVTYFDIPMVQYQMTATEYQTRRGSDEMSRRSTVPTAAAEGIG